MPKNKNPLENKLFMRSRIGDTAAIQRVGSEGKYTSKHKNLPNLHAYLAMIDPRPKATFDQVMRALVIAGYNINEIISGSRKREIMWIRYALIYHLMNTVAPKMSLVSIGVAIGGRDHTTIIHARDTMKDLADVGQDGHIAYHVMKMTEALRIVIQADKGKLESMTITSNVTNTNNTPYAICYSIAE